MLKNLVITFLIILSFSCRLDYDFVEPPEFVIDQQGKYITLRWQHAKGTDIAGYIIYWGEITHFRATPPSDIGLNNTFDDYIYVDFIDSYRFKINPNKFYQFFMKSYDKFGNKSKASNVKYFPNKPGEENTLLAFRADPIGPIYLHRTGGDIPLNWDDNTEPDMSHYEVQAEYINDEAMITTFDFGSTVVSEKTLSRPSGFVGLFRFKVRACDTSDNCSTWTCSDGPGSTVTIDGVPINAHWLSYWMLDAPIIE